MRFSLAALAATLAGTAQAHISGIAVPAVIKPGEPFEVIIKSSKGVTSSYDVVIMFGYTYEQQFTNAINNPIEPFFLGPKLSNQAHSFNKTLVVPKDLPHQGKGLISASLFTLLYAPDFPTLVNFNVSITYGSETSKMYKSSK